MDKIKYIRTKDEQGEISENIDFEIDAVNVDLENGNNLQTEINNINNEINSCEKANNKIFIIDENSTDEEYPSAKAVYELFTALRELIENRE